ncbi:hypothetical protein MAR_033005, partial [Mya arenaria]
TERSYEIDAAFNIETLTTRNSCEFWKKIQTEENTVFFERWKNYFYRLYNCNDRSDFDDVHFDKAKLHKLLLENEMIDPLYEPNAELNSNVFTEEVALIVQRSKSGSTCGIKVTGNYPYFYTLMI